MLSTTYDLWTSTIEGLNCKVANDDELSVREGCAAINLLKYTRFLQSLELFPMLRDTATYQSSPYELYTMLSNAHQVIPITSILVTGRRGSLPAHCGRHGQCHIGHQLAARVKRVLENVVWPVEIPTLMNIKLNASEYRSNDAHTKAPANVDIVSLPAGRPEETKLANCHDRRIGKVSGTT